MPAKPDQPTSLPSASETETAKLTARRRIARAGLSAPIVLGTLASKPVLGAPIYHCTVSGHVSGGSPRMDDGLSCVVGLSKTNWLDGRPWPTIIKGTVPNSACRWQGTNAIKGTEFNGFGTALVSGGLFNTFYAASGQGVCTVSTTTGSVAATMRQVLETTSTDPTYQFGRAVVVSLLNYYRDTSNYPVTAHTIIAMFNATRDGGSYVVNSAVSWNRAKVLAYLTSLYPPG